MHGRLLVAVLSLAYVCLPAAARTESRAPTARLDFKLPKSTTLGEPVIMTATLYNTTGYRVMADFGVDDQTKFVYRQTRPDGTLVKVEPSLPLPRGQRTARLMLRGNTHTAMVVLDEWLDLSLPGVHRIDLEFQGSVAIEGGNEAVVKRTARFSIEVKPRDARRLEKRASGWLKQISTLSPSRETRAAGVALMSMKDPVAIPYLELATSRTRSQAYAEALAAMNSADARASLERLAASRDPEVREIAQRVLGRRAGARRAPAPRRAWR
jgi:hypothetical protein